MTGLGFELFSGFLTDTVLEVTDHQRERMGTGSCSDTVNSILIFFRVRHKGGINSFLERPETETDRNDVCAEHLHTGDVRSLFCYVDLAHVDITFKTEISGSCRQRHAMLAGSGLGDQFLLAHVFGKQAFTHAVIELMGAGMVQIFPFQVDLGPSQKIGQVLAVVDRCRTSLEILPDAP